MGREPNQSSEQDWLLAEQRADDKQLTGLFAVAASYDPQQRIMRVTLKRGFTISFPKERSQVMASARDEDLIDIDIQGFGRYILFPKLDDGFTVESMLLGRFGNDAWERAWAESHSELIAA
jgi:hypothetical protein